MELAPRPQHTLVVALALRCWRWLRICAATLFVCWSLFVLCVRNPLDLWWDDHIKGWCEKHGWWKGQKLDEKFDKVDRVTRYYANFCGIEQGWSMFTPEMARSSPFLAARLEFDDESSAEVRSPNEPADPHRYFRFGGWRQRKLEDWLGSSTRVKELHHQHEDLPVYEAYARWCIRRWHEQHPDERRTVRRVVLFKRRFIFPKPGTDPRQIGEPETYDLAIFGPDGRFLSRAE